MIPPGGEGKLELRINAALLKPGKAQVKVELDTNERRNLSLLIARGQVVPADAPLATPLPESPGVPTYFKGHPGAGDGFAVR